jgi:hypothetical protein
VTVEAAQEILKDTTEGVLLIRDELSGWFGSMERYGTGKGASADRSFWLQAFNGGGYSVNRVGRGVVAIDNLSVSMLGGIQPDPIRKIVADSADDGLLQRLFPICMGTATVGLDVPPSAAVGQYGGLIRQLHEMKRPKQGMAAEVALRFDSAGQNLRQELSEKHHDMAAGWEILNKKLAAHIGYSRACALSSTVSKRRPRDRLMWCRIKRRSGPPISCMNSFFRTRWRSTQMSSECPTGMTPCLLQLVGYLPTCPTR